MNEKEIKKIIENTFDEVSSLYDTNDYFLTTAKQMIRELPNKDNLKILDLSCGTGNIAIELALKYKNSQIFALDLSSKMLEIAKQKAEALNINNITFIKADVENLEYEKNSFDIITCGFALFFYTNMNKQFNDFLSLIKKDGIFTFSSFTKKAFSPYCDIFLDTLQKDYDISYIKEEDCLLDTKDEIKTLVENKKKLTYEIQEVKISNNITVEKWWDILNSAGYKAMLNQLNNKQLNEFKIKHFEDINKLCTNKMINLQTNTLITKVFV